MGTINQNTSIGVNGSKAKGDYTGYGHYTCLSGSIASTITGSPVTTAFHLYNVKLSDTVFTQILIKTMGDEIYARTYTTSGYGSWYKFSGTVIV